MDAEVKLGRGASTHVERRAVVAEICRRIADSERLVDILRTEGMPIAATFQAWVSRSTEFSVMYEAAKADRCRPVRSNAAGMRTYCDAVAEELCARLAMAEGLEEVCAADDMPCEMTVYRWLAEEAAFAHIYKQAREVQAHRRFDEAWRIARHGRWDGWRGAKLAIDTIRWQVGKLAPGSYGGPAEMAAADEENNGGFNVEVVRFSDLPPDWAENRSGR